MRTTVGEIKQVVRAIVSERYQSGTSIDIWDSSYNYSIADSVEELARSAFSHLKKMMGQGVSGPADPKFLSDVTKRLRYIGVPDDVVKNVMFKLRMMK